MSSKNLYLFFSKRYKILEACVHLSEIWQDAGVASGQGTNHSFPTAHPLTRKEKDRHDRKYYLTSCYVRGQ